MSLTDKEAAALERLEQERERRIEQKIADGSAIRVPLPIVHGNAAEVRARKLAMLREAGERREIFFDEDPIDTGVPRALDSYGQRSGHDASGETRTADQPKPAPVVQHEGDTAVESQPARRLRTQIEQPSEANPGGSVAEGWFKVEGGILHVEDMQGRLLGRQPVRPGDDVEAIARKLLRDKTRGNDFYRPINYPLH